MCVRACVCVCMHVRVCVRARACTCELSCVLLSVASWNVACQAPLVHGIFQARILSVLATQACPTHCDPMDCSPPGSSVQEILQARILKWVAIPSSKGSSQHRNQTHISCVSCIGRQVLYQLSHWRSPLIPTVFSVMTILVVIAEKTDSNNCCWGCREIINLCIDSGNVKG